MGDCFTPNPNRLIKQSPINYVQRPSLKNIIILIYIILLYIILLYTIIYYYIYFRKMWYIYMHLLLSGVLKLYVQLWRAIIS